MRMVSIAEAKASLASLARTIETGEESEIIITRDGKPAVKLVALAQQRADRRLGIAAGQFVPPSTSDELDQEIAKLFNGE